MTQHRRRTVAVAEPVRLYTAVMAAWQVILAGSAFADLVPVKVYGLLQLLTAAAAVGWGEWTRSKTTPSVDVVAQQKPGDPVTAGPKAEASWGIGEGVTVMVNPAP